MSRIKKLFQHERVHTIKKHPFAVPVITLLLLVFLSGLTYIFIGGSTIGADDSYFVRVSIDGEQRVLPTRAESVGVLLDRLDIKLGEFDIVEPSRETPIIEDDFRINVYRAQPVTIVDENGVRQQTFSAQPTPRLIAQKAGFQLFPEDLVTVVQPEDSFEEGIIGAKILINRARISHMNIYGTFVEVRTHATTVNELLEEKNIKLNEGDNVVPGSDTALKPDTVVFIVSPGKQIATEEQVIQPAVENILDSNLSAGTIQTRQAGSTGKKLVTYEIDVASGERRPLQEIVLVQAQKKIVVKGTRPLFADFSTDGIPARVFCGSPKQRNWKNIRVQNAAIGRSLAAEYGWTGGEFDALLELFACESSWTEAAGNPYSGAYGIPQAWPGHKMSTAGEDWATNPKTQIIWGLGYIKRVYGSPSRALAKHYSSNYY